MIAISNLRSNPQMQARLAAMRKGELEIAESEFLNIAPGEILLDPSLSEIEKVRILRQNTNLTMLQIASRIGKSRAQTWRYYGVLQDQGEVFPTQIERVHMARLNYLTNNEITFRFGFVSHEGVGQHIRKLKQRKVELPKPIPPIVRQAWVLFRLYPELTHSEIGVLLGRKSRQVFKYAQEVRRINEAIPTIDQVKLLLLFTNDYLTPKQIATCLGLGRPAEVREFIKGLRREKWSRSKSKSIPMYLFPSTNDQVRALLRMEFTIDEIQSRLGLTVEQVVPIMQRLEYNKEVPSAQAIEITSRKKISYAERRSRAANDTTRAIEAYLINKKLIKKRHSRSSGVATREFDNRVRQLWEEDSSRSFTEIARIIQAETGRRIYSERVSNALLRIQLEMDHSENN